MSLKIDLDQSFLKLKNLQAFNLKKEDVQAKCEAHGKMHRVVWEGENTISQSITSLSLPELRKKVRLERPTKIMHICKISLYP